jgi:hypothetical protein
LKQAIVQYLGMLAERRPLSDDELTDLQRLLRENARLFERRERLAEQSWFGNDHESEIHSALYFEAMESLNLELEGSFRSEVIRTMWVLAESLREVTRNAAEWTQALDEVIPSLSVDHTEHFLEFLGTVAYEEAERLLSHLNVLYDWNKEEEFFERLRTAVERKPALRQIALKAENHVRTVIKNGDR